MLSFKPLPFHPLPDFKSSIINWIEKLVEANKGNFFGMLRHIEILAKEHGLIQTLSNLTGVSIEQISRLHNEFKSNFWEKPNQCPIKNCDHKTKRKGDLRQHLASKHDIDVEWHYCSHCDHKAKQKVALKNYLVI